MYQIIWSVDWYINVTTACRNSLQIMKPFLLSFNMWTVKRTCMSIRRTLEIKKKKNKISHTITEPSFKYSMILQIHTCFRDSLFLESHESSVQRVRIQMWKLRWIQIYCFWRILGCNMVRVNLKIQFIFEYWVLWLWKFFFLNFHNNFVVTFKWKWK